MSHPSLASTTPTTSPPPSLSLHFILGPPCAGKSTLAAHVTATKPSLTHISVGALLRALASRGENAAQTSSEDDDYVTGLIPDTVDCDPSYVISGALPTSTQNEASVSVDLPTVDTETFAQIRDASAGNTLLDTGAMARVLHATLSHPALVSSASSILLDGFPRSVTQLPVFSERISHLWTPSRATVVLVLKVSRGEARRRFHGRAREGDEFEARFEAYEESIGDIVDMFRGLGVTVVQVGEEENVGMREVVDAACRKLREVEGWEDVGGGVAGGNVGGDE
ncbi:P-loop containing nucleoside triphosphate hydrolase protein [Bimuria novae-zelandiae CBS 107.79]|uniref:P-loop containing nucleoside triphosphate hydrolase protein n=1 Tax=Bimuria novae-zelandiae CBS 107.79 TaxID=1447943 RepID=A0A6A5VN00_9PLEO|nr:P-loop containing nucleoside triphosphate hydrolase protein [Bimuria novae-zelandiae CBS 107.79]